MSASAALRFSLAAATGLLHPLCFPDFDLGWLAWVVLVPLHVAVDGASPSRALRLGWLAGLIAFAGTMYWVVTAMHEYGRLPLVLSYGLMLLLTAYLGLYVGLYAAAFVWLQPRLAGLAPLGGLGKLAAGTLGASWLAAPFLWVALEWLRTWFLTGLPWTLLGYSQYRWLPIIQLADHTGVYGVSFLVVLVNAALAAVGLWAIRRISRRPERTPREPFPWAVSAAACLGLVVCLGYGAAVLSDAGATRTDRMLTVGLVQPSIDQAHKWDAAYRRETMDRYERLTAEAARGADLVIWPEAATPFLFELEKEYRTEIMDFVRGGGTPLLLGSPGLGYYPSGRPYLLNSAYLVSPQGDILGRYDKQHLVPFGEYVPLRGLLFFVGKLVEGIGDFEAGTVPTVLAVPPAVRNGTVPSSSTAPPAKFGVVICYEVIFPDLVRQFVANGADFMVTITNDAWYGVSSAPYQHFGMVVLRSVENRTAFARAANTGISGLIDPYGRILEATPIFTEAAVTGRIPVGRRPTFYTENGDVFAVVCAIIVGLFVGLARFRAKPRADKS